MLRTPKNYTSTILAAIVVLLICFLIFLRCFWVRVALLGKAYSCLQERRVKSKNPLSRVYKFVLVLSMNFAAIYFIFQRFMVSFAARHLIRVSVF